MLQILFMPLNGAWFSWGSNSILPLWNVLLYHNKVDANWNNVVRYWREYELSDALCSYIAQNIDQLVETDVSSVEDVLIKQLILADMELPVQRSLIPALRLQEFDLDVRTLPEMTLQIMVECAYFDFTPERFNTLYEVYPRLAVSYLLRNQDAFVKALDEVTMMDNLFEELLLSSGLSAINKQTVFARFAAERMTEQVAMKMNALGLSVTTDAFTAAWNVVDTDDREALLARNLGILQEADFVRCFANLGRKYSGFLERTSSHEVDLPNNEVNLRFAARLKEVGYITSYRIKEKTVSNAVLDSDTKLSSIKCRIKQVN